MGAHGLYGAARRGDPSKTPEIAHPGEKRLCYRHGSRDGEAAVSRGDQHRLGAEPVDDGAGQRVVELHPDRCRLTGDHAEMGYGVVPAGGAFATRFELAEFDTIQGVEILFNHTLNNANDKYFDLVLWKDENGRPGNEIYRLGSQRPQWEEQIYKFHFYPLDSIITLAGSFFVGIVQQTSSLINIGFDASNDNSFYTFYNTNGSWQPTEMRGTLMIRPVVDGRTLHGVEEIETGLSGISLYPNPVSNTLNVSVSDDVEIVQTYIFDLTGRKVYQGRFEKTIAVNNLTNGLYLLSLTTANGQVINQKFIISK